MCCGLVGGPTPVSLLRDFTFSCMLIREKALEDYLFNIYAFLKVMKSELKEEARKLALVHAELTAVGKNHNQASNLFNTQLKFLKA